MLEQGQIYKSHADHDWGIEILEFDGHATKAAIKFIPLGCAPDTPKLNTVEIWRIEAIASTFPILVKEG